MNDLQKARRPEGDPGGRDTVLRGRALSSAPILPRRARDVKPLNEQAAQLAVKHSELAAWHRERAARWLEFAHLSPWHAHRYFAHVDAAVCNEELAAALEGVSRS